MIRLRIVRSTKSNTIASVIPIESAISDGISNAGSFDEAVKSVAENTGYAADEVSDALSDARTKESGFFREIDRWYTASVKWSIAHPMIVFDREGRTTPLKVVVLTME